VSRSQPNPIDSLPVYRSILLHLLAISVLVSSSCCNGINSLQNTFAPDPKLKQPVTVGTKDPDLSVPAANSLPTDFPLYPQAKIQATAQTEDRGTVTTWTTPDPIDLVYAFYQKELVATQWD
jgi:hypothetical protein